MALRNIVVQGDPVLNTVCRPVKEVDDHIRQLLDDMADTMHHANGVGLAGPQVGVLRRVIVVQVDDEHLYKVVNPVITSQQGDQYDEEGCLSVPGQQGWVHRPERIVVEGLGSEGEPFKLVAEGFLARAFCHEIDHLDGILYVTKAENLHYTGEE